MKLIYNVDTKPKEMGYLRTVLFALQQLLAIMAATIAVPGIIGNGMSPTAALFGAGIGTLVYLFLTKFKSPVFLGSSFAFIGSMFAAFAGGVSMSVGYLGLLIGAICAGLVYVVLAIILVLIFTTTILTLTLKNNKKGEPINQSNKSTIYSSQFQINIYISFTLYNNKRLDFSSLIHN